MSWEGKLGGRLVGRLEGRLGGRAEGRPAALRTAAIQLARMPAVTADST